MGGHAAAALLAHHGSSAHRKQFVVAVSTTLAAQMRRCKGCRAGYGSGGCYLGVVACKA
jgi:hypothetical protein